MLTATESALVSTTRHTAACTSLPVPDSQLDNLAGLAYNAINECASGDSKSWNDTDMDFILDMPEVPGIDQNDWLDVYCQPFE
ncbi:hypothetical protein N7447_010650 [Penicillium robsamsonii]|uniref:uncharacterized protein n=1 Tax=Penicillium robsamsonii TaxID=1792511 RepID=UPI002546F981|nr:uncharacterized protein N7447_010650 [Penicillium robsamsonii]KAJ5811134.1 hypothetical protein N7447_010650 [Penicillium robsamsonii]